MRTTLILCATLGAGLSAADAAAHPAILRWSYEATITFVSGNKSLAFPGMQIGDDLRGTLAYDRTAAGTVFEIDPDYPNERRAYFEFAPSFELASIVFENPRTGDVLQYHPEENGGVDVWDEYDLPPADNLWLQQYFYSPAAPDSPELVANFQFYGSALDGTDLPLELDVDDWAGIFVQFRRIGGATVTAEIGLLTPVDVPFLPGDFNGDAAVDARDLGVWQWAYGSTNANLAADANLDNRIDGHDFLAWQRQLGPTSSGASNGAVPEPESLGLIVLAILGIGARPAVAERRERSPFAGETRIFRPHKGGIMA